MTLSKLSGPRSRTFDALAPAASTDKKRGSENRMVAESEVHTDVEISYILLGHRFILGQRQPSDDRGTCNDT